MALPMSRPWKHPKTGVFWLRKRIPDDLQKLLGGKREELKSLGTKDGEEAKRRLIAALAELEVRWATLRQGTQELTEREAHRLASRVYDNWLAMHADNPSDQLTWHTEWYDRLWTEVDAQGDGEHRLEIGIDTLIIAGMRRFALQQANFCIEGLGLVVDEWGRFRLAKAVSAAFQRASLAFQDVASGRVDPAMFEQTLGVGNARSKETECYEDRASRARPHVAAVAISTLLERWWREASAAGRKPSTYESYRNTIRAFIAFLGHDDAERLSAKDVIAFKDHRLQTPSAKTGRVPSAKTVKDSDLSALKTIFGWAVGNQLMSHNPATGITIKLAKSAKVRSKGFSDAEAQALLTAALDYEASDESPATAAAKRWVPWLCAFTGARVGELAQLRKQDLTRNGDNWVLRITPEAGTVKNNEAREIVLHPQVVNLGFPSFVEEAAEGHLFLRPGNNGSVLGRLQGLKNRLAEFARLTVSDPGVAPNHGWRHRFKTIGMEAGIAPRILDSIQGQAARSVAETYGDVTIKTIAAAILKLPNVPLSDRL
jgi:integrase